MDQLKPIPQNEGWQVRLTPGTRVAHYIRETMSLCRRVGFYRSDVVPHVTGNPREVDDCAACYKAIEKERRTAK